MPSSNALKITKAISKIDLLTRFLIFILPLLNQFLRLKAQANFRQIFPAASDSKTKISDFLCRTTKRIFL